MKKAVWVEDSAPGVVSFNENDVSFMGAGVSKTRITVFVFIAFLLIVILLGRTFQLQLFQGASWRMLAERNRLRIQPISAERGIIFDRWQTPLVTNVPNFRLTLRAQDLPRAATERENQIRTIGDTIGVSTEKIDSVLEAFSKFRYASVVVKEPVTYSEAVNIYLKSGLFPSLTIERGAKRFYVTGVPGHQTPIPESFAHVLGYVGRISPEELETRSSVYFPTDRIGKTGVENTVESVVRGVSGQRDVEVDAQGTERRTVSVIEPQPGNNVVLTIDLALQRELERTVKNALARSGKQRAAAVAVDPRDGSIRALVSLPAFDANLFSDGISTDAYGALTGNTNHPLLNRAVAGQFPSGSTIKPFFSAAALQEGIITPDTKVLSTGGLQIGDHFFPDWKAGGHGVVDVRRAIAESVNTFFYEIGGGYGQQAGLGPERMKKYLEYFGFGKKTGIDLPNEQSGFLPSPGWKKETKNEQWYIGDTYNMSIGQGDVLVTPLQMAYGVAAIANGGTLWEPRLIDSERTVGGGVIYYEPQARSKIPVDDKWLQVVREGMRQTVVAGSARSLNTLAVPVAGKTGTAQWSSTKSPHAWFVSFAPYGDPQIVVVILVEEGVEGSVVAAPAAKEFYDWWGKNK